VHRLDKIKDLIVNCDSKCLSCMCIKPSTERQPWPAEHVKCSASRIYGRKYTEKKLGNKWRKCAKVQQQTVLVKLDVRLSVRRSIIVNDDQQDATILVYLFIPNQLYMFQAMSSPIISSTWLYLQHLILSIDITAGWCHG